MNFTINETISIKENCFIVKALNLTYLNRWFIFRDNGDEIQIDIIKGTINSTQKLRQYERKFIERNIL